MPTKVKPKKATPPKSKPKAASQPVVENPVEARKAASPAVVNGYLPDDTPPTGALLSLGFQQVLTMFPATVLVAILTKFDVSVTLLASGLGTIIALLVSKRKIPMYYGSSFSYIAVVITAMSLYANDCFTSSATYCPDGVRLVQVGILGTAILEIIIGWIIMQMGKAALDRVLPPIITGSMAIVIGLALAGSALNMASAHWLVALITLLATVFFSVFLQNKGLLGMLPILLGAIFGYIVSALFGIVDYGKIASEAWFRVPAFTLPAFGDPRAWELVVSISLIAIATIPESTAHLYQMSLYIDTLAEQLGRAKYNIKELIGLNLIADGADDLVVGFLGGAAGTNYGENNSLMAITRNYSIPVLMVAGGMAILLGFIGKLAGAVNSIPVAVTGGLAIYLFGVIGMQGVALIQSENVNLFSPKNLAIGAAMLVCGIGGNLGLPNGLFPFNVPVIFPQGIPAIVFAAIVGIALNLIFVLFGREE
ncbi:MAG: xanthine permease [Anaerolineales bacterium]|nr:xanthine permease [Anaerolineales bacterium]